MRIVEEWTYESMRLTVMIMNGRYSLKVENNLIEQTYKFRDGQIDNVTHLKKLITDEFYKSCKSSFIQMDLNRAKLFEAEESEDSFIELI